jgi:hypothetical protein
MSEEQRLAVMATLPERMSAKGIVPPAGPNP